ncbi:MAG TPA: M56 family metallopeptidase [Blastocatellia bacterium]|nr:M56 family metallopeptidase [Blastocatellia bacterium]
MNSLEMLLAKPIFQALGWALVHFIWQGAIVAILYAGVAVMLRKRAANVRYSVACAAMLLMLALPIATIFIISQSSKDEFISKNEALISTSRASETESESLARVTSISESARDLSTSHQSLSFNLWAKERFTTLMPWLVALWFAGVLFLSLRFLGGLVVAQRLKRRRASQSLQQWQEKLSSLCRRLRVSRPVRLCESVLVEVPTVIGWLRPVILVPASALTGLSAEQLEALLAHELAHIKRYDYLINLIQTAVETLLFYHPAVWWLSAQIRQEREHCCDDLAVATCGDVLTYARALAELEHLRSVAPQLAVAANGGALINRIQRLVGSPARASHRFESWLAGVIALATAFTIFAGAQTQTFSNDDQASKETPAASSLEARVAFTSDSLQRGQNANQKPSDKNPDANAQQDANKNEDEPAATEDETVTPDEPVQESAASGSGDFINDLAAAGYKGLSVDELIEMKTHGVTPEFIRDMNALFNRKLSVDTLVAMRVHGITPKFMSSIKDLGYANISAEDLIGFSVHGVTAQYISDWKNAGYDKLSADLLQAFMIHGVTPAFVQEMKAIGFTRLSPDDLVALKIHDVNIAYIQTMRSYFGNNLSADDLTGMRIHGVTTEFIAEMKSFGLTNLSAEYITAFRIHGVSASFIKAIQAFGYKPTPDELTGLRIHGVTPDFIENVRSHGFKDVTLEQLMELRRLNIIPGSRKK